MDEILPPYLSYHFFIQGLLHFPHIRMLVYIFISWRLVLFNLLIFLVYFLVLLIHIFLVF